MTLDPTLRAGIEHDLRHYRCWKARIAELEAELADVAQHGRDIITLGLRVQQGHGDPTVAIVQAREKLWREYGRLRRQVGRIDRFLRALRPELRRLVQFRYFDGRPVWWVMRRLHVSERTFYRMRDEALVTYAVIAGLAPRGKNVG